MVRDGSSPRDGSYCLQPGERLSYHRRETFPPPDGSWSKTDHRRETDLSTASPVSASPENKTNPSWSETDHCGEMDLSTASPVSASPENKKNPSWSETDHRRESFFLALELETGTNLFLVDARVEFSYQLELETGTTQFLGDARVEFSCLSQPGDPEKTL